MKIFLLALLLSVLTLTANAEDRGRWGFGNIGIYKDLTQRFPPIPGSGLIENAPNESMDGGSVWALDAYLNNSYSAYGLVVEFAVKNLAYAKEVFIHTVDGAGNIYATQKLNWTDGFWNFVTYRMPSYTNHSWVVLTAVAGVEQRPQQRFVIEVKMNNRSYWSGYFTVGTLPKRVSLF